MACSAKVDRALAGLASNPVSTSDPLPGHSSGPLAPLSPHGACAPSAAVRQVPTGRGCSSNGSVRN